MATTPQAASKSPTIRRILREAAEISNSPSADYTAEPLESDLFEWHFTLRGVPNSPYSEGVYHGRIVLPPTYPLRPPSFRFMTPNGRFEANREICLSISGHHEETWQPAWGIRTAIVALRSFMITDAKGQLGGYDTTEAVRRRLAGESHAFRCATCGRTNAEIIRECEERAREACTSPSDEVQVPEELNLGFRDELEARKAQAQAEQQKRESERQEEAAEVAQLAEGFVQTGPVPAAAAPTPTSPLSPVAVGQRQAAQLGRTATVPQAGAISTNSPRRPSDEGVPVWLDRLIVALVVMLSALVLKVLFGV
ncbi:unnamed protein product [Clonostachys chloroleuca]|uniref:UBC core domain-containing protein n=1 Tax=Clonostachys chloroleuca TaxID=1926264 RepID=A0AA35QEB0_9HYPO|nr:unnamed protein product [Clonostachys chloroleuca]